MDTSLLPNIYEFISNTYPFSQLSALEKDATATKIQISYHSVGDVLEDEQLAGAGLFMIRTGVVEQRNKDNTLRARYSAGDTFGYTQIDKVGTSDYKVIFLENTLLYLLPKNVLNFLIEKNQAVGQYFNAKEWVRLSSSHNYADELNANEKGSANKLIENVCSKELAIVDADTSICQTAVKLGEKNTDLAMVMNGDTLEGIVTKSDITLKAVAKNMDIHDPISKIMTTDVTTIDAKNTVFDALEIMVMYNIKNLPVIKDGKIYGSVSTTSLLQNSQLQAVYLCQEINRAKTVEKLVELSHQKQEIFKTLVQTNVKPHTIQKVMSHIADSFTIACIQLAEKQLGMPPIDYAFVAAGSLARSEVQFLSDQDNCIITRQPIEKPSDKEYFEKLATIVTQDLDKCGYTLCEGNFMASNPRWCTSLSQWKEYYSSWIANTTEDAILSSSVFLDMRCLFGDKLLVKELREHLIKTANENRRFLATLVSISLAVAPPLGTFRQFVLTKDGVNKPFLNIKKQAINLIIELARVYGIAAKTIATDTYDRLTAAMQADLIKEDDFKELKEAYTFLNHVRFKHQLHAINHNLPLTNNLNPDDLTQFERNHLRDAFRIIAKHQKAAQFRFAPGRGI